MSTLIVFTNKNSLENVTGFDEQARQISAETFFTGINNLNETNCCFFNGQELILRDEINEAGIFLIGDKISNESFNKLVKDINKDQVFILWHMNESGGGFRCNLDLFNKKNTKSGQHTEGQGTGYHQFVLKVKELGSKIYTYDDIATIIEAVFGIEKKINATLEFLHKCILGKADQGDFDSLFEIIDEDNKQDTKSRLQNIFNELFDGKGELNYGKLKELRDDLFKYLNIYS